MGARLPGRRVGVRAPVGQLQEDSRGAARGRFQGRVALAGLDPHARRRDLTSGRRRVDPLLLDQPDARAARGAGQVAAACRAPAEEHAPCRRGLACARPSCGQGSAIH